MLQSLSFVADMFADLRKVAAKKQRTMCHKFAPKLENKNYDQFSPTKGNKSVRYVTHD